MRLTHLFGLALAGLMALPAAHAGKKNNVQGKLSNGQLELRCRNQGHSCSAVITTRGDRVIVRHKDARSDRYSFKKADVRRIRFWGSNKDDHFENKTNIPSHAEGAQGADTLIGGSGKDRLEGQRGNDTLKGGGGNDDLYGGDGNDELRGEGGDDRLFGGKHQDKLYGGDGNDHLGGNSANDQLWGGRGNDRLDGGDDRDTLYGEGGDDTLLGGEGKDNLWGGPGRDHCNGQTPDESVSKAVKEGDENGKDLCYDCESSKRCR